MSEESYIHCIENTIKIAEQLMRESKELRGTMFKSREQARNQMYAQSQQVEMIMRRRVYDIQRARNEMEWQKYKVNLLLFLFICQSLPDEIFNIFISSLWYRGKAQC